MSAVMSVTRLPNESIERTELELTKLIIDARGGDSAHDPGIALAARDAAELAHGNGASLVAVVDHPNADPAVLVGMIVTMDGPLGAGAADELRQYLEDAGGADIHEVTEARTDRGYPVVIAERILVDTPLRAGKPPNTSDFSMCSVSRCHAATPDACCAA